MNLHSETNLSGAGPKYTDSRDSAARWIGSDSSKGNESPAQFTLSALGCDRTAYLASNVGRREYLTKDNK